MTRFAVVEPSFEDEQIRRLEAGTDTTHSPATSQEA
jgi:hypothetical protein